MSENATTETKKESRVRRTSQAARSGLDVMLSDAASGGPPRFIAPGSAVKVGAGLARHPQRVIGRAAGLGAELARAATGRSELAPAKGDRRFADRAWEGNWLFRRAAPGLPRRRRDRRRVDLRRRRRLARRAARAARGRERARRARADQLRLVQPDGDQGDRRHRRRQSRPRRAAPRARSEHARRDCRRPSTRASSRSAATSRPRPDRSCCGPTCSS